MFVKRHPDQHGCWPPNSGPLLIGIEAVSGKQVCGWCGGKRPRNSWPSVVNTWFSDTSWRLQLQMNSIQHWRNCWKQTAVETRSRKKNHSANEFWRKPMLPWPTWQESSHPCNYTFEEILKTIRIWIKLIVRHTGKLQFWMRLASGTTHGPCATLGKNAFQTLLMLESSWPRKLRTLSWWTW